MSARPPAALGLSTYRAASTAGSARHSIKPALVRRLITG